MYLSTARDQWSRKPSNAGKRRARSRQPGILVRRRTPFSAETIAIEFTQSGEVVESHKVPKIAWQAFQLVAAKNGFEAEDFLVVALAGCVAEGMNIPEALRWLMPDETAEMLEAHYAELA